MRPTLFLPLGFLLPVGLSAALAASLFRDTPELPSLIAPAAAISLPERVDNLGLPPLTDVEEANRAIAVRPLFAENRRIKNVTEAVAFAEPGPQPEPERHGAADPVIVEEVPEAAPVAVEPPPALSDIKVIGYTSQNGEARILVRMQDSGREIWMHVGERLETWMLVEITQETATFAADGAEVAVKVFE